MSSAANLRTIAVDWSGRAVRAERTIWLAEARDGAIVRLECGRDRAAIADYLLLEAARTPELIVGFDFAFSVPSWFLEENSFDNAPAFWDRVARDGEAWLAACESPFWGRPGRRKPLLSEHLRRTDCIVPGVGGIRPKSVFQIGGAGAVGTGSLRGMPVLKRLRDAGFSIWPFDPPRFPMAIEIYPRLLTGPVIKSNRDARFAYLEQHYPHVPEDLRCIAASTEDAFDAAVSALVMDAARSELSRLPQIDDPVALREGQIWSANAPTRSTRVTR